MRKTASLLLYMGTIASLFLLSSCGGSRKISGKLPDEHKKAEKEILEKYASLLEVPAGNVTNYPLYSFINEWYGAPYKYAGHTKAGVDCSDFVSILYDKAYNVSLTGACPELLDKCKAIKENDLKEGDLVFFKINSKAASHVGVYLQNSRFVHASVHSGVAISNLNDTYYRKYFYRAGRVRNPIVVTNYKG